MANLIEHLSVSTSPSDEADPWTWFRRIRQEAKIAATNNNPASLTQVLALIHKAPPETFLLKDFEKEDSAGLSLYHYLFKYMETFDIESFKDRKYSAERSKGLSQYAKDSFIRILEEYGKHGSPASEMHQKGDLNFSPSQYAAMSKQYTLLSAMLSKSPAPATMLNEQNDNLLHILSNSTDFSYFDFKENEDSKKLSKIIDCLSGNPEINQHRNAKGQTPLQMFTSKISDRVSKTKTTPLNIYFDKALINIYFDKALMIQITHGAFQCHDTAEKFTLLAQFINAHCYGAVKATLQQNILNDFTAEQLFHLIAAIANTCTAQEKEICNTLTNILFQQINTKFKDTITLPVIKDKNTGKDTNAYLRTLGTPHRTVAAKLAEYLPAPPPADALNQALQYDNKAIAISLIKRGAPTDEVHNPEFLACLLKLNGASDMINEIAQRLLAPALLLEAGFTPGMNSYDFYTKFGRLNLDRNFKTEASREFLKVLIKRVGPIDKAENAIKIIDLIDNLSRTWHHPNIVFPNNLVQFNTIGEGDAVLNREWKPVYNNNKTKNTYTASNGYTLQCLTTSQQLLEEHKALHHCINDYTNNCCNTDNTQRSHIFSVKAPDGSHVATIELKVGKHEYPVIATSNTSVCITQFEGEKKSGVRKFIRNGPAYEAAKEFMECVEAKHAQEKKVELELYNLGETEESIAALKMPADIINIGYTPTPDALDACFGEFKNELRRGAVSVSKTNTLIYSNAPGLNHTQSQYAQHLIDGTYMVDGVEISAREMDAQSWLQATGLKQWLRNYIAEKDPELAEACKARISDNIVTETEQVPMQAGPVEVQIPADSSEPSKNWLKSILPKRFNRGR